MGLRGLPARSLQQCNLEISYSSALFGLPNFKNGSVPVSVPTAKASVFDSKSGSDKAARRQWRGSVASMQCQRQDSERQLAHILLKAVQGAIIALRGGPCRIPSAQAC
jgi:hypothetical protein